MSVLPTKQFPLLFPAGSELPSFPIEIEKVASQIHSLLGSLLLLFIYLCYGYVWVRLCLNRPFYGYQPVYPNDLT